MAGHSKWAQIKRQKAATDAKKSKVFSKLARQISVQAKIYGPDSVELRTVVEKAKAENVPKDIIERAVKRAGTEVPMAGALYETYGPSGVAIVIETLTDNKNRTTQEIKHILSENNFALGAQGSATWAFRRDSGKWSPENTVPLSEADLVLLEKLVDELEELSDVQEVYTNAE